MLPCETVKCGIFFVFRSTRMNAVTVGTFLFHNLFRSDFVRVMVQTGSESETQHASFHEQKNRAPDVS